MTDQQLDLDAITAMPRAEDIAVLVAEVRRLRTELTGLAKKDAHGGGSDRALRAFPGADGTADLAAADNPTQLRWGLDDVLWGDDDTVTVLLSGLQGEPYWLKLGEERAAALRQSLAGPGQDETADGMSPALAETQQVINDERSDTQQ
ncbi:hypothetical protein ACIQF5_21660 [Streptomyces goshikiensis]|uniref:hypothetical protein n=1 Tax=Streptomyces goshikiensis TaxID=1942 RepID=UPI00381152E1